MVCLLVIAVAGCTRSSGMSGSEESAYPTKPVTHRRRLRAWGAARTSSLATFFSYRLERWLGVSGWGLVAGMFIANLALLLLNLPFVAVWVRLLQIPRPIRGGADGGW